MANIDSWRSANRPSVSQMPTVSGTQQSLISCASSSFLQNKSLPGLLEKLNILPRPAKIDKDDSALDTWSESSVDGSVRPSISIFCSVLASSLPPPLARPGISRQKTEFTHVITGLQSSPLPQSYPSRDEMGCRMAAADLESGRGRI